MSQTQMPIEIENLITEDDKPVDNFISEKQQRLLTEPLYSSWAGPGEGRTFLAAANVGIFESAHKPPIVPDMFLSLDVEVAEEWYEKSHRTYLIWEFGKPPEAAIEIVSNREGGEASDKLDRYARIGALYYVIYDPMRRLKGEELRIYELEGGKYELRSSGQLPKVGLGLTLWRGKFEGKQARWLRWCDEKGKLIPTGAEGKEQEHKLREQAEQKAEQERQRAEQERQRAEQERQQAEQERQQAEQERQRAEQAEQRAEQERQRAEQERQRAEQAEQRAEQERQRAERLEAMLQAIRKDPD